MIERGDSNPASLTASAADAKVRAHAADLHTILRNLLHNALTHSPTDTKVDVFVQHGAGGSVLMGVADQGPGIASAQRARVFDPFYRIPGSGESGSGLGLAIVKSLVDQLGATIMLEDADTNAPHPGLLVVVSFPKSQNGPF